MTTTVRSEQLESIKSKLEQAAKKDTALKVFGSDEHQYKIHEPAAQDDVREEEFGVSLPEEYVAFITTIGNGGPGNYGGAGPYYGIYELGEFGYMEIDSYTMSLDPVIRSSITQNIWDDLIAFTGSGELIDGSEAYDKKYNELFAGLMTVGTMGCNGQMMLVLNGRDRGRVVYINQDLYLPKFSPEKGFLDWYENWLDKLIAGDQ